MTDGVSPESQFHLSHPAIQRKKGFSINDGKEFTLTSLFDKYLIVLRYSATKDISLIVVTFFCCIIDLLSIIQHNITINITKNGRAAIKGGKTVKTNKQTSKKSKYESSTD